MPGPQAVHRARWPWWAWLLGVLAALAVALVLLVAFFPWDLLRGPLNRYVSEKTGRQFEISRKLDVELGRITRIHADGIAFANPDWAVDRHLVKADAAVIEVRLWPLVRHRQLVLPLVELKRPQLGLQLEPDGRRTWALGRDTGDPANVPDIGALVVDQGSMHFIAAAQGADIHTDFAIERGTGAGTSTLPLRFNAKGQWQKERFSASGRTGNVLFLSAPLQQPFPLQLDAVAGATRLQATGQVASLSTLDGANARFVLQGRDLAELYKLLGVVLPATPRYTVSGYVSKQGEVWKIRQVDGRLGNSDVHGDLDFDRARQVPHLTGSLQSKALDFDDLAPVIGLPEQPRSAAARPLAVQSELDARALARARAERAQRAGGKVLPATRLDLARLKAMNADVRYSAERITHARRLPLERGSVHVKLQDGVLRLEQMDLGLAGGRVVGSILVDGKSNPAAAQARLDARSLELNKMFPNTQITRASFGKIQGSIDLKARGNSVAQMLAASDGNVALLMGRGQISNLLLEFAGLDGAEIIKFLVGGDRTVQLRCAATAFDVQRGLMTSRALVLDTQDTVVYGSGTVSLADESLDLVLRPQPKDTSIQSLRSPLKVTGNFSAPKAGPEKRALAGRAGLALALGAINPLLALAATIETGPGQDADCGAALREAAAPRAAARVEATAPPPPRSSGPA
ncbi:MAG TPA: AsmA family protein, partial [Ramlibacter sp.]|nr:AsmA family protein [Ramlibacter sp.]